jgi:hypothetical protein
VITIAFGSSHGCLLGWREGILVGEFPHRHELPLRIGERGPSAIAVPPLAKGDGVVSRQIWLLMNWDRAEKIWEGLVSTLECPAILGHSSLFGTG